MMPNDITIMSSASALRRQIRSLRGQLADLTPPSFVSRLHELGTPSWEIRQQRGRCQATVTMNGHTVTASGYNPRHAQLRASSIYLVTDHDSTNGSLDTSLSPRRQINEEPDLDDILPPSPGWLSLDDNEKRTRLDQELEDYFDDYEHVN